MSSVCISLLFVLCFFASVEVSADDPKPEEIVAKHLDSIGTKEKRAEIKNQMGIGSAKFNVVRSPVYATYKIPAGGAVFLSEANKLFIGTKFDAPDYPFDEFIYNGKKVSIPYVQDGRRSILGNFIASHTYLIDEGLLGGTLLMSWNLFDLPGYNAKIKGGGKKKINGRQTYAINYFIKGGSMLSVKFFFDAETFQHVRSEYQRSITPPLTRIQTASSNQIQLNQRLTEDFSNFKQVNGITLPHSYQINLLEDGDFTNEFEWKIEIREFLHNQKIDSASFETK